MHPSYLLLLIFTPVPVVLLYAVIVDIYDRKKQSLLDFNHIESKMLVSTTKPAGPKNHKIGQPSAS